MIRVKKVILILLLFILLTPTKVSAAFVLNNFGKMTYFQGVYPPQITSSGRLQNNYTADSMFPLGLFVTDLGVHNNAWNEKVCATTDRGLDCMKRDTAPEVADAGFNLSYPWGVWYNDDPMTYLGTYKIKGEGDVMNWISGIANNSQSLNYDLLKDEIIRMNNNSNVLMIQRYDDNPCPNNANCPQVIQATQNLLRQYAPNKLISQTGFCTSTNDIDVFQPLVEIMNEVVDRSFFEATTAQGNLRVNCPDNKPVFPYIGAFNTVPLGHIRAQAYMSIVHGATGIWYFLQWPPPVFGIPFWQKQGSSIPGINPQVSPDHWAEVKKTNLEITANKNIILSKTATDNYNIYLDYTDPTPWVGTQSPVYTLLKDTGESGTRYLIVVNTRKDLVINTKFDFPGSNYTKALSLFDNQPIAFAGTGFTDTLNGYDAKIYKITSNQTKTITDLRVLLQAYTSIFDYASFVANYGR